jgi:hypothetical protein
MNFMALLENGFQLLYTFCEMLVCRISC